MKIIFVGMHNKPDKMPLCGSTRSGKLINNIIAQLKDFRTLKTNLYDVEYYPAESSKKVLAADWFNRVQYEKDDILVLLGAEVHENFMINSEMNVIKIAHPSSQRSHEQMRDYVDGAVKKIKQKIQTQVNAAG